MEIDYGHQSDVVMAKTRMNTCEKSGVPSWSDLNHDTLFLVMMRLGAVDFPAFSRVCKPWRSLALSSRNRFLASRPPLFLSISTDDVYEKECYLKEFDGRMFKTMLPRSAGRICVGLTHGYLILYRNQTRDFWLVDPITRHELLFSCAPFYMEGSWNSYTRIRALLVYSPSVSGWLFVMLNRFSHDIWFSVAGIGAWNHVSSTSLILDLHAFKGKIYTLNGGYYPSDVGHLCEMRFDPEPKLTLIETKNFPKIDSRLPVPVFVNYGESFYLIQYISADVYKVHELDFGEMKWMCREKEKEECVFFISHENCSAVVKRESWWTGTDINRQGRFRTARMWYFPHESLNADLID